MTSPHRFSGNPSSGNSTSRGRSSRSRVSRRDLLRYGVAGASIAALGPFGRGLLPHASGAPLTNHKRVVVIYCYGGYDGLNLLVPITNQAYYDRRPTIQIADTDTLALSDSVDYGWHPNFTRMAGLYNDTDVAAFHKVGYPSANLSHFTSQDIYSWGVRGEFAPLGIPESGWIARYADLFAQTPLGAAALGIGRPLDFEGGSTNPFMATSLQNFDFNAAGLNADEETHRMNAAGAILDAFPGAGEAENDAGTALGQGQDLAQQVQAAVASYSSSFANAYPTTSPGAFLRDAAIMIQAGFETEVFFTGFSGWDTHTNQGAGAGVQANLVTRLDEAIGVFSDDLKEMGVWDDTLILIASEFGRRNFENSSQGTDHGHGNTFVAIGGGVNGGLYGVGPSESDIADNNWLDYGIDFRDIYREAITNHLGEDASAIFPEAQDINNTLGYV